MADNWPKDENGNPLPNVPFGKLSAEHQRLVMKQAIAKVKAEFEHPAHQKAMSDWLNGKPH